MKIRFNKYVEIAILAFSAFGFAGRFWALPELTLIEHVAYFFVQILILNGLWFAYYFLNDRLNIHLPFERGVGVRIATQLIIGWLLVEGMMIPVGMYAYQRIMPMQLGLFEKLHFVFIGLTAFFGSSVMNLGFIANHFFEQWRENAVRAAQLEKEKVQVQFENLKNQLNPHFLFNSLASLDSLIMDDPTLARQFLQQLSKVYRYALKSQERGLVSVETEVEFVKNYIALLSTRFADHLSIKIEIESQAMERQIVPMTLQILLENAIKHNALDSNHPLRITILSRGTWLEVTNTVNRKEKVETSNGKGLVGLSSLYHFIANRPLEIHQKPDAFLVRIPLLPEGQATLDKAA